MVADASILSQALDTGAENLPLRDTCWELGGEYPVSSFGATATKESILSTSTTSKISKALGALSVRLKLGLRSTTGNMRRLCRATSIALGYLTDCRPLFGAATTPTMRRIYTMGREVFTSTHNGEMTEHPSYHTSRLAPAGITLTSRWTELTSTVGTDRGISGSSTEGVTSVTSGESPILRRVFDISNAGPRHRFTILTGSGPIIAHNCILGLGYGMGHVRFRHTLMLAGIDIDEHEAQRIVRIYRNKYHKIAALWRKCDRLLEDIALGRPGRLQDLLDYDSDGIILPNGMRIRYAALRRDDAGSFRYIKDARTYRKFIRDRVVKGANVDIDAWTYIYGAKVVENVVQALAGIIVRWQMSLSGVALKNSPAFQVHDENVWVVRDEDIERSKEIIMRNMSMTPPWASDLPLACELGHGPNYGECK